MYNDVVPLGYIGDILLRETYHSDKIGEPAPREEDCYSRLTVISPRVQYESINPNGEVVLLTRCYVWILLRRRWVLWMAVYNDSDKPMPVHYADAPPVAPGCITFLYLAMSWLLMTGFAAVSLQPNASSAGEYAGLLAIRAYHRNGVNFRRRPVDSGAGLA